MPHGYILMSLEVVAAATSSFQGYTGKYSRDSIQHPALVAVVVQAAMTMPSHGEVASLVNRFL